MAKPQRPSLSQSALRALPFIRSGVMRGLSLSALERSLGDTPYSVARSELRQAMTHVAEEIEAGLALRGLSRDTVIDPDLLKPAVTRTLREFSYVVEVTGFDPETGQSVSRFVTVSSSESLTMGDVMDSAVNLASDTDAYEPLEVEDAVFVTGTVAGELGTFG